MTMELSSRSYSAFKATLPRDCKRYLLHRLLAALEAIQMKYRKCSIFGLNTTEKNPFADSSILAHISLTRVFHISVVCLKLRQDSMKSTVWKTEIHFS